LCSIEIATSSERRRRVNPRKVYPIDTGLIPIYDRSGKANIGHALETAVLLELLRRGAEVHYVRTAGGNEVDFLARHPDGREDLIQVCANIDDANTLQRELRALNEAATEHPRAHRLLIILDKPASTPPPESIEILNAHDWLLAP